MCPVNQYHALVGNKIDIKIAFIYLLRIQYEFCGELE